jgi:transcriptional regulator with GAF, ATPase, and Fis domain
VKAILEAHETWGGNAAQAAQALGVAPSTVVRHWKKAGIEAGGRAPALSKADKRRIERAHRTFAGNASRAARSLGVAPSTVRKYWKRAGLETRSPGRPQRS